MVTYLARHVFPVNKAPIENATITFDRGLILAVGRHAGEVDAIDLGDVAIIPGLVNAHTHLEFSDLKQPLGEPGMLLPWWIREVIQHRAATDASNASATSTTADRPDPVRLGSEESARFGVTTIGNITNKLDSYYPSALDRAQFLELRALRKQDVDNALSEAKGFIRRRVGGTYFGLSPHAPYTVHHVLLSSTLALAAQTNTPVAMHLAESREELELLQTSRGPFRDLLEERGWWEAGAISLGLRPMDYLEQFAKLPRSIVVHGNYLNDDEIRYLGENRDRMSVVYCPRTHAYFQHDAYPLWPMLYRGVRVALGTDSRASNPDLDLRKEMQFVIERCGVTSEQALRLGTINGAIAMGLDTVCGTISPGKAANLAILQLPNREAADPHDLLFEPEARVVATICRGQVVFSEHPAIV